MKVIVDLSIMFERYGINHLHVHVGKTYETGLVPIAGMLLIDSVWTDAREIKSVIIDPENGYYLLNVGDDSCLDLEESEQRKAMYHSHGWTRYLVQEPLEEMGEVINTKGEARREA
jgi:hypothetical protein